MKNVNIVSVMFSNYFIVWYIGLGTKHNVNIVVY